ncbi:SpoIIE family protein phosphatase [Streptomyces sp. NPDC050315]|uniref:PP2C family protein-serine/threonine phosphatase n=1 Tax=Streptomyces sp. NPDC050315 TaxID=3155039 RepID=UPI00343A1457
MRVARVEELLAKRLGCDEGQAHAYARGLLGPSDDVRGQGPQPGRPGSGDSHGKEGTVRPGGVPARDAAGLAAARGPTELARRLHDHARPLGAAAVLLAVLDMDGVLRMSGVAGASAATVTDWSQVPLRCVLPLARMAVADQLLWLDDETGEQAGEQTGEQAGEQTGEEAGEHTLTWVSARSDAPDAPSPVGARCGAATEHAVVCVVSVIWPRPVAVPATGRARLEALTAAAGQRLRGLAALGLPDDDVRAAWLGAVIDAIPAPAALLFPVRGPLGRVVEFTIDRCNTHATELLGRTPEQVTGSRLLDAFPGMVLSGIFDAYVRVLETGVPLHRGPFAYEEPFHGALRPAVMSVRAQRVGGGLLVSWCFHDEQARMRAQIDDAERLVHLGWAEWNLVTGDVTWSRRMYDVLGLNPAHGPVPLDTLSEYVAEDDLPAVVAAVRSLSEDGGPVRFEVRTRGSEPPRHVSVNAELVRDSRGRLVAVQGVVQDVSAVRRMQAELAASRREAAEQQLRRAEELQLALLPTVHPTLPGLRVAVRYQPAENCTRVGGDWFEAAPLPDGRVLIAIGDVSGHGLRAAAKMAQLRNALLGIAHTGADAAEILDCLNLLAFHGHEDSMTATAVVGHFDPDSRTLTWARAGHPRPVLVRGSEAAELDNDDGTTLGASLAPGYGVTTTVLRAGDRVVLYTDGLVERRADRAGDREDLLLAAARQGADGTPEQHLQSLLSALHTDPEDDTCVIVLHVGVEGQS